MFESYEGLEKSIRNSIAVCARYFPEVYRLAYSDDEIYATFYGRLEAGICLPGGDRWERLRAATDTLLFDEPLKRQIRFAALTLPDATDLGLTNYGDWILLPRESMIAHRASVFEENSVLFFRKFNISAGTDYEVPPGYRAPWEMRDLLAMAKLAPKLAPSMSNGDFASLLLRPGPNSEQDEFVEVHIWGSLTIRSFEKVSGRFCKALPSKTELKILEKKLGQPHYPELELP